MPPSKPALTESERLRRDSHCRECGEELWGPLDKPGGLCAQCREQERADMYDDRFDSQGEQYDDE